MTTSTPSPLKGKPLRNPGQSVDEARQRLYEDRLETPLIVACGLLGIAALEGVSWYLDTPRQPILYAGLALAAVGFLFWRAKATAPQIRALKQAAEGERTVGQYLEKLRAEGYEVFHDIPSVGFNLDHVIIGPGGVFAIETKTWSKPSKGEARITFDGESLHAGGFKPDRNPVVQSKAQVSWLTGLLLESTGRKFAVRGVVLFPGWFIEPGAGTTSPIWVLNPKALPEFLKRTPAQLTQEDVKLASFHLSRYIRGVERETAAAAER
jgi:hypothetical protein